MKKTFSILFLFILSNTLITSCSDETEQDADVAEIINNNQCSRTESLNTGSYTRFQIRAGESAATLFTAKLLDTEDNPITLTVKEGSEPCELEALLDDDKNTSCVLPPDGAIEMEFDGTKTAWVIVETETADEDDAALLYFYMEPMEQWLKIATLRGTGEVNGSLPELTEDLPHPPRRCGNRSVEECNSDNEWETFQACTTEEICKESIIEGEVQCSPGPLECSCSCNCLSCANEDITCSGLHCISCYHTCLEFCSTNETCGFYQSSDGSCS